MSHINRKYIDSHWGIFIFKGLVAFLFGGVALLSARNFFSTRNDFNSMMSMVGIFLLCLSIIEFINALNRAHMRTGWAVSVGLAIVDAVIALALLFTLGQDSTWALVILAVYTFLRGLFEIISGFRATVDPTDRFTWVFGGMCGCVMGFAIFNSGEYFVRFFGAYLLIIGACSLFYGVHNRSQKLEDKAARKEAAALAAKTRKKNLKRSTKKSSKK